MKKLFKKLFKSFLISVLNDFADNLQDEITKQYSANALARDYAVHSKEFIKTVKNKVIDYTLKNH